MRKERDTPRLKITWRGKVEAFTAAGPPAHVVLAYTDWYFCQNIETAHIPMDLDGQDISTRCAREPKHHAQCSTMSND